MRANTQDDRRRMSCDQDKGQREEEQRRVRREFIYTAERKKRNVKDFKCDT